MTRTVAFISAKGGSGKTVTASGVATFLAALSFRVLLVDTDAATNGLTLLYLRQLLNIKSDEPMEGLFEVDNNDHVADAIEITEYLKLIPAAFSMSDTEAVDIEKFDTSLGSVVSFYKDDFDFILLDAQAGADAYAKSAVSKAEDCIIVSEYDPVSAQGVDRIKVLFNAQMDSARTWILFNKVLPEFSSVIGDGLAVARYLPPLPWDADVVRAFARRDLAINVDNPNPYTLAIAQMIEVAFPDEVGAVIESWKSNILSKSTNPVVERLNQLSLKEATILKEIERQRSWARISAFLASALPIALVSTSAIYVLISSNLFSGIANDRSALLVLTAIISVVASAVAIGFVTYFYRWVSNRSSDDVDLEIIQEERRKLRTVLSATESALKKSENVGYYGRLRQRPSDVKAD